MKKKPVLAFMTILAITAITFLFYEKQKEGKATRVEEKSPEKEAGRIPTIKDEATNTRLKAQTFDTKKPNWEELSKILKSEDSSTRFLATTKLGEIRETQSVSLAIERLRDKEQSVRQQAARSIESLTGFEVDEAKLDKPDSAENERKRVQEWWKINKSKSVNELRLETLKTKTSK